MTQDTPSIYLHNAVNCAGSWRTVFFHVWFSRGGISDVRESLKHQLAVAREVKDRGMLLVTVIHEGAASPVDNEMRAAIGAAHREIEPYIKAGALIMLGRGFGVAIVRGLLAGFTLIGHLKYPYKVFDAEEAAFRWLAGHVAGEGGRPARPEAIDAAYRRIVEPPRSARTPPYGR